LRVTVALAIVAAICLAVGASTANADPIAGAAYRGIAADGAGVQFTISADGTLVDSYKITEAKGDTCIFTGEGDKGVWEGAPIVNGSFAYALGDAIVFRGSFPGPQSLSGTFRFFNAATSASRACDSGTVTFNVTTTATPPPPPGGGPGGGPSGGPGHGHRNIKPTFGARVALHKLSQARLGGRIRSSSAACRARRKVVLWLGPRRIASTRTKTNGTYWFARPRRLRGHHVRASVSKMALRTATCSAATSKFITA